MTTTPYFLCTIWSPANKFSAHLAHRPYMFNSRPFNSSLFCLPSFSYDLFISWVTRLPRAPSHFFFAPERKMEETQENEFMAYIFKRRYAAVNYNNKTSQLIKHGRSHNYVCAKNPHFQNEPRCTTFLVKMSFICMKMKSPFHSKGWALNLVLIQRPGVTRKWLLVWSGKTNLASHVSPSRAPVLSKWGQAHNISCENEFYLNENEKSFPQQRLSATSFWYRDQG